MAAAPEKAVFGGAGAGREPTRPRGRRRRVHRREWRRPGRSPSKAIIRKLAEMKKGRRPVRLGHADRPGGPADLAELCRGCHRQGASNAPQRQNRKRFAVHQPDCDRCTNKGTSEHPRKLFSICSGEGMLVILPRIGDSGVVAVARSNFIRKLGHLERPNVEARYFFFRHQPKVPA